MRKTLLTIILLLALVGFSQNFVSSLRLPHPPGFFVEFTSIGFSTGDVEISTNPIMDILGFFNATFRLYLDKDTVLASENYFVDIQFIDVAYAGLTRYDDLPFIVANRSYLHADIPMIFFTLRPHAEFLAAGPVWLLGEVAGNYMVVSAVKGFIELSLPLGKQFDIFGRIESGVLLDVFAYPAIPQENREIIDRTREESLYTVTKIGGTYYYDNYSGIELGYKIFLMGKDSPLTLIQGSNLIDWLSNYLNLVYYFDENANPLRIPFITTEYYLNFSVKF